MKKRSFYFLFILAVCTLLACEGSVPDADVETIVLYKSSGSLKTFHRKLEYSQKQDSVIKLNYEVYYKKDTTNNYFEFPINGKTKHQYSTGSRYSDVSIRLMDSVVVRLNNEKRTIYKFKYDEIHTFDEESLIYYIEDIGIIREESYIWMNHSVLVDHPNINKALLYGYQEKIRTHLKPFDPWGEKRPPRTSKRK